GLLTAWAVKRVIPSIQWGQLLIIVVGWIIGWWFIGMITPFNRYSRTSFVISSVIAGALGGLLTGCAVKQTIQSIQWWQLPIIALGWIIGHAWVGYGRYSASLSASVVLVNGIIMGAIGAGVTLWLLFLKIGK